MQEREEFRQLFERYRQGRCTPEEKARLHAWFNHFASKEASGLNDLRASFEIEQAAARRRWLGWLPYAAAMVIITMGSIWYVNRDSLQNRKSKIVNLTSGDIAPGGNRATLTLADGRTIDLSTEQSGIIVADGVTYPDGSSVLSEQVNKLTSEQGHGGTSTGESGLQTHSLTSSQVHRLATPQGGTYQITLPDGTMVWLNSASTLKYPARFEGRERIVEIEGEAYFAVAKAKDRPFKVVSNGQEIDVLGTEFNVSAYVDDGAVKTTLVEGKVKVSNLKSQISNLLRPGEQSTVREAATDIRNVETNLYTAWKDGNFYFDNTPLSDMMKQIARWYDVEVTYERNVPQELFSGGMSRNVTLQTVLELLRVSEIKYRIEKNKLIIE